MNEFTRIFLIFLVFTACTPKRCCKDDRIKDAVARQLETYPASTLTDIYKSFFQDEFGPGHMLEDTAAARDYLEQELNAMTSQGRHAAEPCGAGQRFVRVPMDLVKDGHMDPETFFHAFLSSADSFSNPDPHTWSEKWGEIVSIIDEMHIELSGFEEDKKLLSELLGQGQTVMHHSRAYTDAYDPHYRIMTLEKWNEIMPE